MKIEDLREKKSDFTFHDLAVGDVFKKVNPDDKDWTFMKIPVVIEDREYEYDDNAVCLEDGDLIWFDWDEVVVKVEAKVVIEK
jgi:hypothetical protein